MEEMPAPARKCIDQQEKKSCSGDEVSKSKMLTTLSRSQGSRDWKPSQKMKSLTESGEMQEESHFPGFPKVCREGARLSTG